MNISNGLKAGEVRLNFRSFINYFSHCSFTSLDATRNLAKLSETLYPQYLTWNRLSWKVEPTQKVRLVPWYILSVLVAMSACNSVNIAIREILRFQKDPEINVYTGITGLLQICINSFNAVQAVVMISTVDEVCTLLNNVQKMRRPDLNENGM